MLLFLLLPGNLFARGVQEFVTTSYSTGDVKLVWKDFVADVYLFTTGIVTVTLYSSPTRPINGNYGLRYAVSFDDGAPIQISVGQASVIGNVRKMQKQFNISRAGQHVLKVWIVDPAMVLDKIVIDTGGVTESYLGPPESFANQEQPADR